MRGRLAVALSLLPTLAAAGEVELAGYLGPALPTYEQSFRYDPGPLSLPAGITVTQEGVFGLEARGGLAFGGGLSFYFTSAVGVEARVDSAAVEVVTQGARFTADLRLPAPLPPISARLEPTGTATVDRLNPVSLNLKLRTPGRVRLVVSGGVSWLPSSSFSVTQNVGLGVTLIGLAGVTVPTLPLRAGGGIEGVFGVNAGVGLHARLARRVGLVAEGRVFRFRERTLAWTRGDDRPLSALEQLLVQEVQRRLGPVEFEPTFFQVTAGLTVRF